LVPYLFITSQGQHHCPQKQEVSELHRLAGMGPANQGNGQADLLHVQACLEKVIAADCGHTN
jgi:hypothetical protein